MELNLDYISTLTDEELEGVLPQLSGEQRAAIEGVLARRQGIETPESFSSVNTSYDSRRDAVANILSGQFIRDIDAGLQEENILPFASPDQAQFRSVYGTGGAAPRMENVGYKITRNKKIKEDLLSNLSQALAIDESQIDIESGLGDVINRGLLSFQEDPEGKYNFLVDQYGKENVSQFTIGNKPSFLVKKDGKQVLVDEQGASFGDLLDVVRPGAVLGTELLASLALPGATAPRMLARAPILTRGLYAGAGATVGELGSEAIEAGPMRSESLGEFAEEVEGLQSLKRGGIAGAFDVGFGKAFAVGAKAFTAPGVKGADISQEDFLNVLKRMEERTGIEIVDKTTPSMRAGTRATEAEGEVVSKLQITGVSDDMQPRVVQNRLSFNNALGAIIKKVKGEEVDFADLSRIGKEHFEALEQAALDSADDASDFASQSVAKYFKQLGESLLPEAQRRTSKELGEGLRSTTGNIFNANKAQVDSLYDEAISMGDDIPGIDMLTAARRLLNIDGLSKELPTGIDDRVIRSFIPKNVLIELSRSKELSKQAKARLKQIAEFEDAKLGLEGDQFTFTALLEGITPIADPGEPLTLSFRQLLNAKKQLNKVYGQAARGDYLEKKQLRSMIDSLDGLMEGMARDAGSDASNVLKDANKLWKEKRLPLLEDRNLQNILGNTRSQLDPSDVTDALLGKRRGQVQSLIALRNAAEDPEAFSRTIRESAIDSLFAAAENTDKQIDLGKLSNILKNNDLMDEFFDRQTIRSLQRMARTYSGRSKNLLDLPQDATVTPSTLRKLLTDADSVSPVDKRILQGKLNDERNLSIRVAAINTNEAQKLLREGGGNVVTNVNSTVNALLNLRSASQVKVFMDTLDEAGKEGVRALVRKRIFDSAVPGSSGAKMGDQFGGARLPSADSKIFQDLRDTTSTPYEVAEDILGSDGVQDVLDLVTILDRVGRDAQQEATGLLRGGQGQVIGRGGQAQTSVMPRLIATFNLDVPYTKLLGIAMTSEKFINLASKGRPSDLTLAILPAIYSSDNAFQLFTQMAAEDPSLIRAIDVLTQAVDIENSDLLR